MGGFHPQGLFKGYYMTLPFLSLYFYIAGNACRLDTQCDIATERCERNRCTCKPGLRINRVNKCFGQATATISTNRELGK